jgi:hypothetical protein
VVSDLRLSPDQTSFAAGEPVTITVEVTNQGSETSAQGFWVDLYLNPDPVPDLSTMPLPWDQTRTLSPCQGITWQVSEPLGAGETITLTSTVDSMGVESIDADYSRWGGWFAAGTTDLHVYVDSWGAGGVGATRAGLHRCSGDFDVALPHHAGGGQPENAHAGIALQSLSTCRSAAYRGAVGGAFYAEAWQLAEHGRDCSNPYPNSSAVPPSSAASASATASPSQSAACTGVVRAAGGACP